VNTYRFRALPKFLYAIAFPELPELTVQVIGQTLTGATVHELTGDPTSGYDVHMQLDRSSHHEALDDIRSGMEQLGFNVAQVLVTEWLSSVLEGALVGGAGGGALGAATKDPWVMAAAALLGALAGAAAGSLVRTVKARFDAQLLHPFGGGWRITPQAPPLPAAGAWGPAPYYP
jgi:hypothetical protein